LLYAVGFVLCYGKRGGVSDFSSYRGAAGKEQEQRIYKGQKQVSEQVL
jgi:hypothetical protein